MLKYLILQFSLLNYLQRIYKNNSHNTCISDYIYKIAQYSLSFYICIFVKYLHIRLKSTSVLVRLSLLLLFAMHSSS